MDDNIYIFLLILAERLSVKIALNIQLKQILKHTYAFEFLPSWTIVSIAIQ